MKSIKIIVLFMFLAFGFQAEAQQFKFKTTSLTVREKESKNFWGKWSSPINTELYVSLDFDKNKMVVYSREVQHYRILEVLPKEQNENEEINSYLCKNQFGEAARVSFMVRKDAKNKTQLYIYFKDIVFCYDIIEVTD